jgi:hypothetical protein
MRRIPVVLALSFAVAVAGCAARKGGATGESATRSRRDPSVVDSVELWSSTAGTVYDLVSSTRADWLLPRGGPQANRSPELGIWIEGQLRTRPTSFLTTIRPVDIKRIRRLSPTESLHTYSWPWGGLVVTPR